MKHGLVAQIVDDWRANGRDWTKPGFRSLAVHRFGVWRLGIRCSVIRAPLTFIYRAAFRFCRNVYGIELPYTVRVGKGVVIEHQGGIIIHGASVIGDRCIIRQNCTLGLRHVRAATDAPTLEDDVELGAGSVILGAIKIGKGCSVGANAVVLRDMPANSVVVGIPARVRNRY